MSDSNEVNKSKIKVKKNSAYLKKKLGIDMIYDEDLIWQLVVIL